MTKRKGLLDVRNDIRRPLDNMSVSGPAAPKQKTK